MTTKVFCKASLYLGVCIDSVGQGLLRLQCFEHMSRNGFENALYRQPLL